MSWPSTTSFGPRYEVKHPKTGNAVKIPDRGWRWKEKTFNEAAGIKDGKYLKLEKLHDGSYRCGRIWFSENDLQQPSSIKYLDEVNTFLLRSILSYKSDGGLEVERLFGGKNLLSHPKPTSLIMALIDSLELQDNDIVLDFFAGSCTTAHAVMKLNATDGIKRRFFIVQLPEKCQEDSEASKAGFSTIADIGSERIRRAASEVVKESGLGGNSLDTGFRLFRVDTSNMKDVYYTPDAVGQETLAGQVDNIKDDRTDEDLLFQVLLDWGVDLTLPITPGSIQGKRVYFVDDNALAACFEPGIDEDFVKELAQRKPLRAVFRDNGYHSDATKINVEQIFKLLSPTTEVKTI